MPWLNRQQRLHFFKTRIELKTDGFDISMEDGNSIEGCGFKPGLRINRERGQEINHSDLVYELCEMTLQLAPDGARYKGAYLRDSNGPRFTAIADNNWEINLVVKGKKNNPDIFFSIYHRNYNNETIQALRTALRSALASKFQNNDLVPNGQDTRLIFAKNMSNSTENLAPIVDSFWEFVQLVSSLPVEAKMPNQSSIATASGTLLKRKATVLRYYIACAANIYIATHFGQKNLLPRGGGDQVGTFDLFDDNIAIGGTKAAQEIYKATNSWRSPDIWREHVIPCKVIIDEAINIFQKKNSTATTMEKLIKVALMIRRNLALVYCTTEEARQIDKKYKSSMPEGWDPINGNILARFRVAGIEAFSFDGKRFL